VSHHNQTLSGTSAVTVDTLQQMKRAGEKIVCLTAYDASFASILDNAGVDIVLVGDSLGNVVQGRDTTVPVSVEDMTYHTRCASRGVHRGLLVADMPFLSFATPDRALDTAVRLMGDGGARMVKLEGGEPVLEAVRVMSQHGVPVMGHLGLLPQSINQLGGYRMQGKSKAEAKRLLQEAKALEEAGARLLVLECVPADLARDITRALTIPTIGIGAGPNCDGQVLVLYDMLGITPGKKPRFVKDFMAGAGSVQEAVAAFAQAVRSGDWPEQLD
jgi:3-methyl-2-oxobutanoate hydroxymethyltransferase